MKKVLLSSMILLSVVSFGGNVYAQDAAGGIQGTEAPATAKAEVTFTADGNTLIISGQGDLTSYMTTDRSARVFTDKAVGFVFTDDKGTKVNAKDSYSESKTYYQAEYEYSLLYSGVPESYKNGFAGVTTSYSWKDESKLANLYAITWDNNGAIGVGAKVEASTMPNTSKQWTLGSHENLAYYIVSSKDIANTTLSPSDYNESSDWQVITMSEFIQQYVAVNSSYTIYDNQSLFVKHNESADYEALVANKSYTYKDGDQFYKETAKYIQIENNEAFFGEKGSHPDYIQADPTELSFNDLLLRKITDGAYEKVKFVNESLDVCLINSATIQSVLFPNAGMNNFIKELDLGQVTLNNFSSADLGRTSDAATCMSLETLTLPLTNKSTVKSETTKADVSKMVVPSSIIPKGYTYTGNHLTTIHIPEGYERVGNEAFKGNSQISQVTFPNTLEVIGTSAFQNCGALREIVFNEGLQNIGELAFAGNSLTSVKFPSTLLIVDDGAFETTDQKNRFSIKLNAGLKYIGNSAFALGAKYDEEVLEIPASVRYIGPFAFNFRQYQDVYFYGQKAPFMPIGKAKYDNDWGKGTAFSEHTLDGNTGFDPTNTKNTGGDNCSEGYANRENYKNGGAYFCILHYPKDLDDTDRATYTDITRIYKTDPSDTFHKDDVDGGNNGPLGADIVGEESESISFGQVTNAGKRVNWGYKDTYLGAQYIWPSQAQFSRAYATASNGLCWNGKTTYRPELTEGDLAVLAYAGYNLAEDGVTNEEKGVYSMDDLQKIAHLGTRQFVLANADVNEDKEPEKEPEYPINIKGGQWWTLCVPFNMTKAMVDETFGENTEVCLFDKVRREIDFTSKKNRIVLFFTQNVYKHKTAPKNADGTWNFSSTATAPADNEIVIYAHESYMIHPTKTDKDAKFVVKNYTPVVGSPTPTVVTAKNYITGSSSLRDDVPYRYVGNYLAKVDVQTATQSIDGVTTQSEKEVKIPKYSYVFAKAGNEPPKFWFLIDDNMTWMPNKCVIQTNTRGDGALDYEEFFEYKATKAKQASFFGEDFSDSTTSIEDEMVIIAGEGSDASVYNLDGTLVNTTGELTGLAKGIYIKGGKKYVVK